MLVTARREDRLQDLVGQIKTAGEMAFAVAGDVRDKAHANFFVEVAVAQFGGLDIAFNNAGGTGVYGPTPDLSLAHRLDTITSNCAALFSGSMPSRRTNAIVELYGKTPWCNIKYALTID